jgi:hypothetical protein
MFTLKREYGKLARSLTGLPLYALQCFQGEHLLPRR